MSLCILGVFFSYWWKPERGGKSLIWVWPCLYAATFMYSGFRFQFQFHYNWGPSAFILCRVDFSSLLLTWLKHLWFMLCENRCCARDFSDMNFWISKGTYACRLMEFNDPEISCCRYKKTVTDSHRIAAYNLNLSGTIRASLFFFFLVFGHFRIWKSRRESCNFCKLGLVNSVPKWNFDEYYCFIWDKEDPVHF